MKLFKKKEEEETVKADAQKANEKWDKLQKEIDELNDYGLMLCPVTNTGYGYYLNDDNVHNNVLHRAICDRLKKLKGLLKEIET